MLCLCYLLYLRASFTLLQILLKTNFLLALSLEAFARICVTGFLFDPEVSLSSLFRSPFRHHSEPYPTTPAGPPHSAALGRLGSLSHGPLGRGNTITKRFSRFSSALLSPFALAPAAKSPSPYSPYSASFLAASEVTLTNDMAPTNSVADKIMQTAQRAQSTLRDATFFSNALRSDKSDTISLPFQMSVDTLRDKAHRNLPYLRQSWTRIDFIAIVSFWITFALATTGMERGTYHIGLFRAMSVIRTARLLSITSGTTVSLFCVFFLLGLLIAL
jgi:voltage-dependent calcium channel